MDWDDEYDNGYNDMVHTSHRDSSVPDTDNSDGGLDFKDIANPVSAYFFLSDDAQDEISGTHKKKMKCHSCGYRFMGETYDSCPKCYSVNTEEVIAGINGEEEVTEDANMKCLDCGHTFLGETYDSCPECFSPDTEETVKETEDGYW